MMSMTVGVTFGPAAISSIYRDCATTRFSRKIFRLKEQIVFIETNWVCQCFQRNNQLQLVNWVTCFVLAVEMSARSRRLLWKSSSFDCRGKFFTFHHSLLINHSNCDRLRLHRALQYSTWSIEVSNFIRLVVVGRNFRVKVACRLVLRQLLAPPLPPFCHWWDESSFMKLNHARAYANPHKSVNNIMSCI